MKISRAVDEYLASLAADGRSPHTIAAYRRDLDAFVRFAGDVDIRTVTPETLTRFMASDSVQVGPCGAPRAKSTINRYRVALKALFAWAGARWLIQRNPTAILKCQRHRAAPPVIVAPIYSVRGSANKSCDTSPVSRSRPWLDSTISMARRRAPRSWLRHVA